VSQLLDPLPLWCRKLCRHQLAKSSLFAVILQLGQAPIEGLRDLLEIASVKLQQLRDALVFLRQPRPFRDLTFLQRTKVVPTLIRKLSNARANQWPLLPKLLHRIVDQTSEATDEPTVPTKQTDAAPRAAGAAATPNQRGRRERTAPHAAGGPEGPRSPAHHVDQLATPLGWRGVGSAPPTRIQVRG
jgi:hypothetical protein